MTAKRVLFVTYGGGHVAMVLPVIAALRRVDPDLDIRLMALTIARKRAEQAGEPAFGFAEYLDLVDSDAARAWGERLLGDNSSPDVARDESIAYLGINYLDLIAQHGEAGAAKIHARDGRGAFLPTGFMKKLIARIDPYLVVTTNSPRSEEAALRAATEFGVPNLAMIDLFDLQRVPFTARDHHPDTVCVIAETVRQKLIAGGLDPATIHVTGNPAFDTLFDPAVKAKADAFRQAKRWQALKPILFAGVSERHLPADRMRDLPIAVETALRAHIDRRDDAALIIRYHPSDWHTYPAGPFHPRIHVSDPAQEPLHPLLLASAVTIVQVSTVGLEAAVAGIPSISLEFSPSTEVIHSLADLGVTTPCNRLEDLTALVDQAMDGELESPDHPYRNDGKAAGRVADLILDRVRT